MATIREQIIQAAIATLNTGTPAGVPQAVRSRLEPYTPGELPACTVKPVREEIEYEAEGKRSYFRRRVLTLRISYFFTGADESAADPMVQWATQKLDGQVFTSLIEDSIEALYEWEYAAEDAPYFALHQDFRIHYHTVVGDQTRAQ